MDTVVITDQQGMQGVYDSVRADFERIRFEPVLRRGFQMFAQDHSVMFAEQREPAQGPAWKPLAPSTIRRKGHDTILVETGRLRGSLTSERHSDGIREIFDNWPDKSVAIFGTDVPYAQYHMQGNERMPARPHVGTSEQTVDKLTDDAANHAVSELAK